MEDSVKVCGATSSVNTSHQNTQAYNQVPRQVATGMNGDLFKVRYRSHTSVLSKTSCERNGPIRRTSGSAYRPHKPTPSTASLRKISYKYNSVDLYSGVVFIVLFLGFGLWLKLGLG